MSAFYILYSTLWVCFNYAKLNIGTTCNSQLIFTVQSRATAKFSSRCLPNRFRVQFVTAPFKIHPISWIVYRSKKPP